MSVVPGTKLGTWLHETRGVAVAELQPLPGGAGARRYARVYFVDGTSAIWMHARPEDPEILPPALRSPSGRPPFATLTRLLSRHGVPVPEIYAVRDDEGWLLLEDLGDLHLGELPPGAQGGRLEEAIDLLVTIHSIPPSLEGLRQRCFDEDWIAFELDHFLRHAAHLRWHEPLRSSFVELGHYIAELPRTLCHRDFQSQNLMVDPRGRLRLLDYQDALLAPPELDLVSLLHDSYLTISPAQRGRLLDRYAERSGRAPERPALAALAVQRKCKDYARFRYIVKVKQDHRFAPYPRAARAAVEAAIPDLPASLEPLGRTLLRALHDGPP
ncbi:MAG: aminoglycoside phosphotransferase family protein [Myxococcota bacterium]